MYTIENTLFLGRKVEFLTKVGSTNTYALEILAKSKPPEGTVIAAHHQTAGRGQIGSHWESEPGKNLTFSVILYPGFLPVRRQFLLTQALSLGVADALGPYIPSGLTIKWPNDLYIHDHKIGGILLQNNVSSGQIVHTVAGFGINVNQTEFRSDAPNPVSLSQITGRKMALEALMEALCPALERRYLQLREGAFVQIKKDYLNRLYRLMEDTLFRRTADDMVFSGRIVGVRDDGKLVVAHRGGEEEFGFREVRVWIS